MESFKNMQKNIVLSNIQGFIDEIVKKIPDLNSTIKSSLREKDVVATWHNIMNSDLHMSVKYCKAIESIQNAQPTCYHACEYRDFDALALSLTYLEEYKSYYNNLSTDEKRAFWCYISSINQSVRVTLGYASISVPTREEIQENIKLRRTRSKPDKSFSNAFRMTVLAHYDSCSVPHPSNLSEMEDEEWEKLCDKYTKSICTADEEGNTLESLCNNKNPSLFMKEWPILDEIRCLWKDKNPIPDEAWTTISQTNSFAHVQKSIPSNMMKNIEQYAQKIAGDLSSGKMNFNDMCLDRLGQDVLSQCSTEDMEALSNNMSALLPTLSALQSTIGR